MKYRNAIMLTMIFFFFVLGSALMVLYMLSSKIVAPHQAYIGEPPVRFKQAQSVQFNSELGNTLFGWYAVGQPGQASVLLLHGIGGNRWQMLNRAIFLNAAGYTVLLFDLQAHGESFGQQVTLGYRESYDVVAAYNYLKTHHPNQALAIIGFSLGGAAVLLSPVATKADALVLEAVYSTLERATTNRLVGRLGAWGEYLTPLLTWQIPFRLGVSLDWFQPIDRLPNVQTPVLFIAGAKDKRTQLSEIQRMYTHANQPKELWVLEDAAHVDFYAHAPEEYENRILMFFKTFLTINYQ